MRKLKEQVDWKQVEAINNKSPDNLYVASCREQKYTVKGE